MLVTEYNEEETMERFKEDGVKEERMRVLVSLMKSNNWTPERAVDSIMIPNNQREIYIAKLKKGKREKILVAQSIDKRKQITKHNE